MGRDLGGQRVHTDSVALVEGSDDTTKRIRFEVDGLTTGTTRVVTIPDSDITLADASEAVITTGCQVWVDCSYGSDVTGTVEDLNKPFATVQAALTAGVVAGVSDLRVILAPGGYAEDATIPEQVESPLSIGFTGVGAQIRSLTITASTTGGESILVDILEIDLGGQGAQTVSPLVVEGDAGNVTVLCNNCNFEPTTNNVDGVTVAGAGAGTFIGSFVNCTFGDSTASITGSDALVAGKGTLFVEGGAFYGSGGSGISLTGATAVQVLVSALVLGEGAGTAALTTTATGLLNVANCLFAVDAADTGDMIADPGGVAAGTVLLANCLFQRGGGSGGIDLASKTLVHSGLGVDDGGVYPAITASTSVRQPASLRNLAIGANAMAGAELLRVVGANTLRYEDTNEGVGKVLTSDANGVASWAAAAGGGQSVLAYVFDASEQASTVQSPNAGTQLLTVSVAAVGAGTYEVWGSFVFNTGGTNCNVLASAGFDISGGDIGDLDPSAGQGFWSMVADSPEDTTGSGFGSSGKVNSASFSVVVTFAGTETDLQLYGGSEDGNNCAFAHCFIGMRTLS